METSGRERRHRYYTVAAYRKLVAQEQLDPSSAGFNNVDFTRVGEFSAPDLGAFYENEAVLVKYQDAYKVDASSVTRKKKPPKNPVLPDGTVKLGRPRKVASDKAGQKRKLDHLEGSTFVSPPTKRRRLEEDGKILAETKSTLQI
jgi:transcription factor C subunit 3